MRAVFALAGLVAAVVASPAATWGDAPVSPETTTTSADPTWSDVPVSPETSTPVAPGKPGKTVTVTQDVTVTSCEAVVTDCAGWSDDDVPADGTATATWADVPADSTAAASTWADVPVSPESSTPVAPAAGSSTWADVAVPVASATGTGAGPVSPYESKPVSPDVYTGSASKMAGAGLAAVAAFAALL